MGKRRYASQPRIPGACRLPQSAALEARIMAKVTSEATRYNVSRSFIVAVALADALGVELDEGYHYHDKRRTR